MARAALLLALAACLALGARAQLPEALENRTPPAWLNHLAVVYNYTDDSGDAYATGYVNNGNFRCARRERCWCRVAGGAGAGGAPGACPGPSRGLAALGARQRPTARCSRPPREMCMHAPAAVLSSNVTAGWVHADGAGGSPSPLRNPLLAATHTWRTTGR